MKKPFLTQANMCSSVIENLPSIDEKAKALANLKTNGEIDEVIYDLYSDALSNSTNGKVYDQIVAAEAYEKEFPKTVYVYERFKDEAMYISYCYKIDGKPDKYYLSDQMNKTMSKFNRNTLINKPFLIAANAYCLKMMDM